MARAMAQPRFCIHPIIVKYFSMFIHVFHVIMKIVNLLRKVSNCGYLLNFQRFCRTPRGPTLTFKIQQVQSPLHLCYLHVINVHFRIEHVVFHMKGPVEKGRK